jgi:dolichyl-phosphate-mannose-protein mannosyltransferase
MISGSQHGGGQGGRGTAATLLQDTRAGRTDEFAPRPLVPFREVAYRVSRAPWFWMLLTILLVAALPRLWGLMTSGFRGDEAVYAGQAGILAGDGDLDRYFVLTSRGNSNFLLYQELVGMVYFLFGVTDVAARLVSAAFSIGTVFLTFELARTLYGRRVAFVAALALGVCGYAVMLGRLALLDSTLTFFFTLSLLAFAKWLDEGKRPWLLCFAAAAALTMQAKVTGVLVVMVALLYLLVSRELWRLKWRDLGLCAVVFFFFMTPVFVQLVSNSHQFFQFLSDSSARVTNVPWHYYLDKLGQFDGYPMLAVWALGIAVALRLRERGDRLLLAWAVVLVVFFQSYPLKAFNYLLPLVPALSILAARGLYEVVSNFAAARGHARVATVNGRRRRPSMLAPVVAAVVILGASVAPAADVAQSDSYYGLREAGRWLRHHTDRDAGVMTLSKGSAQYALSWYAHRDSYPFGRFRLATIFPGGHILSPRPSADGGPSRDWISYWPPRLINDRRVSYLVYYTDEGDDPPEAPIVESEQQRRFRNFIEAYGGKLVHTVRRNHEGRAWIYRVTELLAEPRISFARRGEQVVVRGEGFRFNSRVRIYYHRAPRGYFRADRNGSFTAHFQFPFRVNRRYWMAAIDDAGNVASGTGLTRSGRVVQTDITTGGSGGKAPRAQPTGPLNVDLKVQRQVPVGSQLPVVVHVQTGATRSSLLARANVSLVIRSQAGARVSSVRLKERETNQLGDAHFNLAALELPGDYTMAAYVEKGPRRGKAEKALKVKRR